ncbi:MAG: hypothetical protein ACYTG7_22250 [Planctomycetota bacterium]|jgi:hypothetical protein
MTLNYILAMGGELDLLLNIDGFNEVAVSYNQNYLHGIFPIYPALWRFLAKSASTPELDSLIGDVVVKRALRAHWAQFFLDWGTPYSITLQFIWKSGDRFLKNHIDKSVLNLTLYESVESGYQITGPGTFNLSEDKFWKHTAMFWKRCSVQLMKLCRENDIQYFHFLQPNQYVQGSKPMGEEEREVAISAEHLSRYAVEKGYPELIALADDLRRVGVNFHDMTLVFSDVEEPLYIDNACHFNARGNEILARKIAPIIGEACNKPLAKEK